MFVNQYWQKCIYIPFDAVELVVGATVLTIW